MNSRPLSPNLKVKLQNLDPVVSKSVVLGPKFETEESDDDRHDHHDVEDGLRDLRSVLKIQKRRRRSIIVQSVDHTW